MISSAVFFKIEIDKTSPIDLQAREKHHIKMHLAAFNERSNKMQICDAARYLCMPVHLCFFSEPLQPHKHGYSR